jgi:N-acetylglucosamine-6-phosphate deacetylase
MGIPEKDAFAMASRTPAELMGLKKGEIKVGYDADFIILDDELGLIRAIARGEL